MPDEPLWTASDVARFLSVSERTVRAWQLDHKLPFLKIGGTVRFVPSEIRLWASYHEVRPGPLSKAIGSRDTRVPRIFGR